MQGCVLMVQMKKLRGPSESGHKLNRLWYYFLDRSPASICKQTSSSLFATYHKMINTDGKPVRDRLFVTPLVTPAGWPACLHTAGVERGLGVVTARPQQVNRSSWWHDVFQGNPSNNLQLRVRSNIQYGEHRDYPAVYNKPLFAFEEPHFCRPFPNISGTLPGE